MEVEVAEFNIRFLDLSRQDDLFSKILVCLLCLFREAVSPPYAPTVLVDSQTRSGILYE